MKLDGEEGVFRDIVDGLQVGRRRRLCKWMWAEGLEEGSNKDL